MIIRLNVQLLAKQKSRIWWPIQSLRFLQTTTTTTTTTTMMSSGEEKEKQKIIKQPSVDDVYMTTISKDGNKIHIAMPDDDNSQKNQKTITTVETVTDTVPDTVLQYERQMRKMAAAKRAESEVTKEEHLKIIYQDEHLVVTDKPSGVLCVPGVKRHSSLLTLVHQEYAPNIQPMDKLIVHRLDMDTSGLVVFGRTPEAVSKLHQIFRDRMVEKSYESLVCGHVGTLSSSGIIDLPLQRDHKCPPFMRVSTPSSEKEAAQVVQDLQHHGWKKIMRRKPKPSTTEFTVLAHETLEITSDDDGKHQHQLPVTRLQLKPITGRTHQLRVHCAAMGHPIVGDPTYGIYGEASANGGFPEHVMDGLSPQRASLQLQKQINDLGGIQKMCLHAKTLSLKHPITGEEMSWEAKVPF